MTKHKKTHVDPNSADAHSDFFKHVDPDPPLAAESGYGAPEPRIIAIKTGSGVRYKKLPPTASVPLTVTRR